MSGFSIIEKNVKKNLHVKNFLHGIKFEPTTYLHFVS